MVHLRIVTPADCAKDVLDLLRASPAVVHVIYLQGVATKPDGDVILCDVAREDASLILADLRELRIHERGSIAIEEVGTFLSKAAEDAEKAAVGLPSDAVVWEEVEHRTSESTELSMSFLAFMAIATSIAAIGIIVDSQILIIGAMVVGPEFGPLAGLCVALATRRTGLARRSATALAAGFPAAILAALVLTLLLKWTGIAPTNLAREDHTLTQFISHPDEFSFIVAYLAGTAGVLSLSTAKSGALIGVLISVTTIPAAGNMAVAAAYSDWNEAGGALEQLALNLGAIILAGIGTLALQRAWYLRRRRRHLDDPERAAGGLPLGRRRSKAARGERK
jgi:uncharacterized hydrophobic protein (TIGR00271 family)